MDEWMYIALYWEDIPAAFLDIFIHVILFDPLKNPLEGVMSILWWGN